MHRLVALAIVLGVGGGVLHAADQTILGKQLLLKDPRPGFDPTKLLRADSCLLRPAGPDRA